ncbi:MAG: ABC transporter permease [Candidatus Altarchaeum sp.]|nr:ABC transporter permease [Candidatus Altarchaeum sp.]
MINVALKNLLRNKTRNALTILGITIGVALLLSLMSISDGINKMISNFGERMVGTISVFPEGKSMFTSTGGQLSKDFADELENFEGVDYVIPYYGVLLQDMMSYAMGVPVGKVSEMVGEEIKIKEGRMVDEDDKDERVAVISSTYLNYKNTNVGDKISILGKDFEVIGKLEEGSRVAIDVMVPIDALQEVGKTDQLTGIIVKVSDVERTEEIAEDIKSTFGLEAETSKDLVRKFSDMTSQIGLMTYVIGGISGLIGGIGIANTMFMNVSERRREIGIMKAIGATRNMILKQFLQEAIILGLIGGIVGITLAFLGIYILSLMITFAEMNLNLIFVGFLFSVGLSTIFSIYPAYTATKVDPIIALKYE